MSRLSYKLLILAIILVAFALFYVVYNDSAVVEDVGATPTYPVYQDNEMVASNAMALVNLERNKRGLESLSESEKLNNSACEKLRDMVSHNYWSHISPSGVDPWYWFDKVGYKYTHAAENLAHGHSGAAQLVGDWMSSQGHKDNILGNRFTEQGMCIQQVNFLGSNTSLSVSHFGSKK